MKTDYAALSDPGRVRENNEDAFVSLPDQGLFAVADGMGGHKAGEVASAMALETLAEKAVELPRLRAALPWWRRIFRKQQAFNPVEWLHQTITQANRRIFEAAQASAETKGMGTTLALVLKLEVALLTAHVGDSRVYRVRRNQITQLTQDHSLAEEMVRQGAITPEEALYSVPQNVLTRALGVRDTVNEEIVYHSYEPGDLFLLCSDGLTTMVEDQDLARIASTDGVSLKERAQRLVAAANEAGGKDNITVVLVSFG